MSVQFLAEIKSSSKSSHSNWSLNQHNFEVVMPDFIKTEQLHAVPKADIDKMFAEMHKYLRPSSPLAKKLRGMAYSNTFLAVKRSITTT